MGTDRAELLFWISQYSSVFDLTVAMSMDQMVGGKPYPVQLGLYPEIFSSQIETGDIENIPWRARRFWFALSSVCYLEIIDFSQH